MLVLIEPLISSLHNIQLKLDAATGAAVALELRLRIIAELEPKVQKALKKPFYKARLEDLISAALDVFQAQLSIEEKNKIESCRIPRNKLNHGSLVALAMELNGGLKKEEPPGRVFDSSTRKQKSLKETELVEGVKYMERSRNLDEFACKAREASSILEAKVLHSMKSQKLRVGFS